MRPFCFLQSPDRATQICWLSFGIIFPLTVKQRFQSHVSCSPCFLHEICFTSCFCHHTNSYTSVKHQSFWVRFFPFLRFLKWKYTWNLEWHSVENSPFKKPHLISLNVDFYLDLDQVAHIHKNHQISKWCLWMCSSDPGLRQDWMGSSLTHVPSKFCGNLFCCFCVIVLTNLQNNQQTNRGENIT